MEEGGQVWLVSEGNGGLDTDLDATWGSLYSNSTRKYKHIVVILLMTDIPLSDQNMFSLHMSMDGQYCLSIGHVTWQAATLP